MQLRLGQTNRRVVRMQKVDWNQNMRFVSGMNFYGEITLNQDSITLTFKKQQKNESFDSVNRRIHLLRIIRIQHLPPFAHSLHELANILALNSLLVIEQNHKLQICLYDNRQSKYVDFKIPLTVTDIQPFINQKSLFQGIQLYTAKRQHQERAYQRSQSLLGLNYRISHKNVNSFRINGPNIIHMQRQKISFLLGEQMADITGSYHLRLQLMKTKQKLIYIGLVCFDPKYHQEGTQKFFFLSLNLKDEKTTNKLEYGYSDQQIQEYMESFCLEKNERRNPLEIDNSEYQGNFVLFGHYRMNTWTKRRSLQFSHTQSRILRESSIINEQEQEQTKLVYQMSVNRSTNSVRWSKNGAVIVEEEMPWRMQQMAFYWMIAMHDKDDCVRILQ